MNESKTIHEVILQRLRDFDEFFTQTGEFSGQEYLECVKPLHEALLELAKKDKE